ncbi:COR domain-containing protein [Phaeodactylibacter xiamenensis]|uniref:COR domain-containing protein n=1 Tax=Phaeodactylibacter xiamenensis TaxID=1524460 RepID=UPI0024A7B7AE|nr:COR domain-containing protein [Phaeodactylibacter xiamenensis]
MVPAQQLEQLFGTSFSPQPNIPTLRQFHANNAYCTDEEGNIIGICFCENEREEVVIPESFSKLQYLNLSDNAELRSLTFEGALPQLWHLDFSDSAIEVLKLPDGFEQLKWLDGSRNQLKSFVPAGTFPKLGHLDLSGNQLPDFGAGLLQKFPNLERLYLKDNPFPSTKITSVNREANCLDFMHRFWLDLQKGGTENKEFKVLLVGNGGVGKTCLVERLVYNSFEKRHLSTEGVALEQYAVEDFPYVLNLWDFGGQDIYHATHRLFMQSNAIYLVLWDEATKPDKNPYSTINEAGAERHYENFSLGYWLHYVRHLGGKSPAIVVKTKMKAEGTLYHPMQNELQAKYGPLDFTEIDSKEEDWGANRFNRLRLMIQEAIAGMGQKQELPKNWESLRQHLRELYKADHKVLSVEEYLDIASDYDVEAPMEKLTDWLVTSGVVFYRKGFFQDAIILDQGWAIKAIYAIFERKSGHYHRLKNEQKGAFSGKDLQLIWAEKNYSEAEQEMLASFMLGCEICFETKQEKDQSVPFAERQFFAPQMMPEKVSVAAEVFLDENRDHSLLYVRYAHDFLHYGIIQSFVVRTQAQADVKDIWQFGILLRDKGGYALVRAEGQAIHVITKEENLALLSKIRNTLEDLQHDEVQEYVSRDGKAYVETKKLQGWKQDRIPAENGTLVDVEELAIFQQTRQQERFSHPSEGKDKEQVLRKMEKEKMLGEQVVEVDTSFDLGEEMVKVLFLQANPTQDEISWKDEYTTVDKQLARSLGKEKYKLYQEEAVSVEEMIEAIENCQPHIIHFCGHGTEKEIDAQGSITQRAGIVLHNEDKNGYEVVDAEQLEQLFRVLKEDFPMLKIVILNACHSRDQATAISKADIFAVGTQKEIISGTARKFAAGFYSNLFRDKDVLLGIKGGRRRSLLSDKDAESLIQLFYQQQKIYPK